MRAAFVAGLVAATLLGCTVEREQPDLKGQDIRLTIIHTADIHSRLFPYNFVPNRFDQDYGLLPTNAPFGGIARITTLVKQIRATSGRSLWLDSGDCFEGAPVFNMFKGEAEMRALSLAGLDGAVVGNHEFDLGSQNLFKQIDSWSNFPLLAANYWFEDPADPTQRSLKDVVHPYQIYDVDGLKVGVIGLGNTSSMTGIFEGGNSLGIRPLDSNQILEQYARFLRPMVDVLVVVSHLGLDEDEGLTANQVPDENQTLPVDNVDVVLGGHLHIVTNPPKILQHPDDPYTTVLVHSGAFAKYVGRLDLVVHVGDDNGDPAKRSRVTSFAYKNIPVDSTVPDDPDIAELMWPYSLAINQEINLNGVFADVSTAGTAKIVRNDPSGGDSQLGNLVARSMQVQPSVEADFALTNSLGIRADFEQGPLTVEQMFNVFPFENTITVMYLSGQEVQDTLDFVARKSAERGCRSQAQVAGIWFDMVCSGTCPGTNPATGAPNTACAKNIYLGENCRNGNPAGPIVPNATCRPVVSTGLYRVAVNNYIAAGGSGFDVLRRNTSKEDTGVSLRDGLTVYLRGEKTCGPNVPVDPANPTGDKVIDKFGKIACLDETIEPHDGRIRPVFE